MLKRCTKCQVERSLDDFYRDKSKSDGRTPRCKTCLHTKIGHAHLRKPDKLCNACKVRKPRDAFWSSDNKCKSCKRERDKTRSRNAGSAANKAKMHRRRAASDGLPYFTHGITKDEVEELYHDMPACLKCGSTEKLRLDHVHPVALGGKSIFWNYQVLCQFCNGSKGASYADYREGLYA